MPNVLLLIALPEQFREYYNTELRRDFPSVNFIPIDHVAKADPHLADMDVLVTFGPHLRERAEHVFRSAANLKWVQALGTGVDNIAEISTLRKEVILTNIHGIHGTPMSEACMAAMLALARELPRVLRNQDQNRWERFPPLLLSGRTAGIFGVGAIAEVLAPRLKMMDMKVVGISSSPRALPGFDEMRSRDNLADAVRDLDHLILLTPYTAETHHIISAPILAAMKPGSFIINLARGGVLDEAALIDAMKAGHIGGAALDVFAKEPLPADHPFWSMKNVILTPHLGGFNQDSSRATMPALTHNLRCFLAGEFDKMVNRVAH
jgi:D-2-hydroxyacid dehydrogenase (NADP+)